PALPGPGAQIATVPGVETAPAAEPPGIERGQVGSAPAPAAPLAKAAAPVLASVASLTVTAMGSPGGGMAVLAAALALAVLLASRWRCLANPVRPPSRSYAPIVP